MSTPTSAVPVDLRPFKLGELVDRAAAMWRQNFGTFFRLYLVIEIGVFIATKGFELFLARYAPLARGGAKLLQASQDQNQIPELFRQYGYFSVGFVVFMFVAMVLAWIGSVIGSDYAVRRQLGESITLAQSVARWRSRAGTVFGATLLASLWGLLALFVGALPGVGLVVLGAFAAAADSGAAGVALVAIGTILLFLGLLIGLLWWVVRFMLTAPVLAMEDVGAWRAVMRSGALVSGRVGPGFMNFVKVRASVLLTLAYAIILVVSALFGVPAMIVQFAYANPMDVAHANPDAIPQLLLIPAQLLQVLAQAALTPLLAIVGALFYVDMRVRREGLDLELKMAAQPKP